MSNEPRKRPDRTQGITTRVETGCGYLYVTVNRDEHGLCEVFLQMGKCGGCAASQLEAIGRLISLALRGGIETATIVKQLRGIRCPNGCDPVTSCADAVGRILEERAAEQADLTRQEIPRCGAQCSIARDFPQIVNCMGFSC